MSKAPPMVDLKTLYQAPELSFAEARPTLTFTKGWADGKTALLTSREFLQFARTSIAARDGLVHGALATDEGVCALGAMGMGITRGFNLTHETQALAEAMQRFNDSMPWATPRERRDAVLGWIDTQLKDVEPKFKITIPWLSPLVYEDLK